MYHDSNLLSTLTIDANRGDLMLGWDTDQFPTDIYETAIAMYILLKSDGFTTGGLNFDAKIRRQSIDPEGPRLLLIAGMPTGLQIG